MWLLFFSEDGSSCKSERKDHFPRSHPTWFRQSKTDFVKANDEFTLHDPDSGSSSVWRCGIEKYSLTNCHRGSSGFRCSKTSRTATIAMVRRSGSLGGESSASSCMHAGGCSAFAPGPVEKVWISGWIRVFYVPISNIPTQRCFRATRQSHRQTSNSD